MITEEFVKGGFSYKIEHYGKEEHVGFFHQMFCQATECNTTTYGCDDVWGKRTFEYPCGYLRIEKRHLVKEK